MKMIMLSTESSLYDPADVMPIRFDNGDGGISCKLAAVGWRVRLAIWFLRRYVRICATGI